jgi:mono/diheme cytochrome c family protein
MARRLLGLYLVLTVASAPARADAPTAAERGKQALLGRSFTPGPWALSAYDNAWKQWQPAPAGAPAPYAAAFRAHYGLHPAPYENGGFPMGLREGTNLFGKSLVSDCLLCHGGSILGKSYIGLGNSALDIQALFEDLARASGLPGKLPFTFSNMRGTTEAGTMAVYLLARREPDLGLRFGAHNFPLRDDECEDVPAWWLLKKKKRMYHTGTTDARSVRAMMQFMLASTQGRSTFEKEEPTFADIREYLMTLEPPKYPFSIDRAQAQRGEALFGEHCARCHGTYGAAWTYPSKVVPLKVIGTDSKRYEGIAPQVGAFYNRSWFAQETGDGYKVVEPIGYQAPPLDGVWATAPYLHNGSVPTLYDMLHSKTRPHLFTRSYRTDTEAFDATKVGWKVEVLERGPAPGASAHEQRKIYDTTRPGRGNGGHTFGDDLTDEERWAVIEYLKTL